MEFFQIADLLTPGFQHSGNVLKRDFLLCHQHHQVIDEVADFADSLFILPVFCGDDDLRRFLPNLFEDFIHALLKQIAGIRALRRILLTVLDYFIKPFDNIIHTGSSIIKLKKQLCDPV